MSILLMAQSAFTAHARTGNAALDTVVASLVLMLFGALVQHGPGPLWREICRRLAALVGGSPRGHGVTIYKMVPSGRPGYPDRDNVYYQAVSWYVTHVLCWQQGALQAQKVAGAGDHNRVVIPAENVEFAFGAPSGLRVRAVFSHDTKAESASVLKIEYVRLTVDDATLDAVPLLALVDDMAAQFDAAAAKTVWQQRLFSVTYDADKKAPSWRGALTNNHKTWRSVVMEPEVKARLMADVRCFLDSEAWYRDMGLAWTRGYMFHGPPGTGKTSSGLAMSHEAQMDIYNLDLGAIATDEHLRRLVELIPPRAVVVMEDVDAMSDVVLSREAALPAAQAPLNPVEMEPARKVGVTLSGLLNVLDGMVCGHGRVVVMTSNHADRLDPALVRPGRIDMQVLLGRASRRMIADMFALFFPSADADPLARQVDAVDAVGTRCDGRLTPAEISNVLLMHRLDAGAACAALADKIRAGA
jgi:hypothetical protein